MREHVDVSGYDFIALDRIMPHPDYAAQNCICVLSPTEATLERMRTLLAEAYELGALAQITAGSWKRSEGAECQLKCIHPPRCTGS
jgi:hypothetical protein